MSILKKSQNVLGRISNKGKGLNHTQITSLPESLPVSDRFDFNCGLILNLPESLPVPDVSDFNCGLMLNLPESLSVHGVFNFSNNKTL